MIRETVRLRQDLEVHECRIHARGVGERKKICDPLGHLTTGDLKIRRQGVEGVDRRQPHLLRHLGSPGDPGEQEAPEQRELHVHDPTVSTAVVLPEVSPASFVSQVRSHLVHEVVFGDRLRETRLRPRGNGLLDSPRITRARLEDHGNTDERLALSQPAEDVDPVHVRQRLVQQDEVWMLLLDQLEGVLAGRHRGDMEVGGSEDGFESLGGRSVTPDAQDERLSVAHCHEASDRLRGLASESSFRTG